MEKGEEETRWFLIRHKGCKAIFTIDSHTFLNSFDEPRGAFRCPNCGEVVVKSESLDTFIEFLKQDQRLREVIEDSTIR
jgi:transcription initiation factor IIE alpha subunit